MIRAKEKTTILILSFLFATIFAMEGTSEAVEIGLTIPETGPYAEQGKEQLNAFKLAIDEVNAKGGLPGGQITYTTVNTQSNPEVAVAGARNLISRGAVMLTGGSSSAVAAALSAECQRSGVLFMAGLTNANQITGTEAHRHTFRWYSSAHQSAKALSKTLVERFGNSASYAYIYADYSWGQDVTETMRRILESQGARTVYTASTPLGAKGGISGAQMKQRLGFLAKLEEVVKAAPTVLVCSQFGADLVGILQQAQKMRLMDKMAVVAPIMDLSVAKEAGSEAIYGVLSTMPWYHGLADQYEGSRRFVQAYERAYGGKPGTIGATAYVNIIVWADAVKRAGTTDPKKVIPALEDFRFSLLVDEEYFRKWDHQGIRPVFVVEGRRPAAGSEDYFSIVARMSGEEASRTMAENPVRLEMLPGETVESAAPSTQQ